MVDYIGETRGNVRLPGIMMLGYVAAHSENLAMAVIISKVGIGRIYALQNLSILRLCLRFGNSGLFCFVSAYFSV